MIWGQTLWSGVPRFLPALLASRKRRNKKKSNSHPARSSVKKIADLCPNAMRMYLVLETGGGISAVREQRPMAGSSRSAQID